MDLDVLMIYITLFISLYFEIFMLLTLFENHKEIKKKKKEKIDKSYEPTVSIIVPCWNEEDTVAGTLKSLLHLDYPKDKLKIFVVNDGSTDNTVKEVEKFLPHPQITLISKKNGGKHTAMNEALKHINSEIVGSLDADSFVNHNALRYIVPHFKHSKVGAVTSAIKVLEDKNLWAQIQKNEFIISILVRKIFAFTGSIFITPGPFSIMRTKIVKELGGWKNAHNTEDMEIGVRIQINNYIIENEERAKIYTKPLYTFKALYKQRLRWLYGFLMNSWDYRYIFFNKKYGNLGMFVLPYSMIAVISVVIIFILLIWKLILSLYDFVEKIIVSGFKLSWPSWDVFFFETDAILWIILTIILLTLFFIRSSKKMLNEEKIYTPDILLYFIVYGLISPTWLITAFFKAITGSKTKWEDN